MTSLANQLKALAVPHTQAVLGSDRKRASLLFDPNEAANLDKEAVFAIGLGGLEELIEIDQIFLEYEKTLFNEAATSLQRLTQTSEINKKLDETVKSFLIHLSPYFLLRPAHKALEWLIYRYQIHFYSVDDLLMCAFPYHDSNIFTRLVQLFNFSNPKSKWHWLESIQKHGTHLPTQTIATHIYKDEGFLNFVATIPEQSIQVHGSDKTGNSSPLHAAIGFYTKAILAAIQLAGTVKESFIAQLAVYLLKGLKSKSSEFKCSSYMILSALSCKVELNKGFLDSVLPLLTRRMTIKNGFEAVSCLVLIFQTQLSLTNLPKRCFKHICRLPGIVQHITQLHAWGVLENFWRHLIEHLVPAAIKDCRIALTSSSDGGGGDGGELTPGRPEYWSLLESLLNDCVLSDANARILIRLMCEEYAANKPLCATEESSYLLADRIREMLRLVEQKYSALVDDEIKLQMSTGDNNELMQEFALMTVSSFKYKNTDKDTSLVLLLNHSLPAMRAHAVKCLIDVVQTEKADSVDFEFVSSSFHARLLDQKREVIKAVLCAPEELLLKYLTPTQLIGVIKACNSAVDSCCLLLSKHADSMLHEEKIFFVLLNLIEKKHYTAASHILSGLKLGLCKGFKGKVEDQQRFLQSVASNIIQSADIKGSIDLLYLGNYKGITRTLIEIFLNVLDSKNLPDIDRAHVVGKVLQLISRHSSDESKTPCKELTQRCMRMFEEWPNKWFNSKYGILEYTKFMSILVEAQDAKMMVTVVNEWLMVNTFHQCLVTLLSVSEPSLCLNLLHLVFEMAKQNESFIQESFSDNAATLGCIVSLLTSHHKLIRKASMRLIVKINNSLDNFPLKSLLNKVVEYQVEVKSDGTFIAQVLSIATDSGKNKKILSDFLGLLCDTTLPEALAERLLIALGSCDDFNVLKGILPLLEHLLNDASTSSSLLTACISRYNESCAAHLSNHKQAWDLFTKSLSSRCQLHALAMVTKDFYRSLDDLKVQHNLLSLLITVYQSSEDVELHMHISKLIRRVTLPGKAVLMELESYFNENYASQSVKSKKMRRSQPAPAPPSLSSTEWCRVRVLLEWIQNKKKLSDSHLLITELFRLMALLLEIEYEAGIDYLKHLFLGCLENILERLSAAGLKDTVTSDQINVELVVQCIRTSDNPQTHQQALLLLKATARIFPDVVLHHIMSIFTYMGANLMRQDDLYSFQIITKTLDSVVPELVKASSDAAEYTITNIIRVFVDSYPHIPEHRRTPLFSKLLATVEANKYLHACASLCIEALTTSPSTIDSSNELEWKVESNQLAFLLSVFSEFSVVDQLDACKHMLLFLCELPGHADKDKQAVTNKKKQRKSHITNETERKKTINDALFNCSTHTDKQLRHFMYECAGFLLSLISSTVFIEQVVNNAEDVTSAFMGVLEAGLKYITLAAKEADGHSNLPTYKFWKALLYRAYEILDKINALLPASVFIAVISSLLNNELALIRRKAMDMLNNRLPQTALSAAEMQSLIELLPQIKSIALDQTTKPEQIEDATNRQTALFCLKIVTRILASVEPSPFIELLSSVGNSFGSVHMSAVQANALLLMGELVYQLSIKSLPYIPQVLPKIISILLQDDLISSNNLLWLSALTALLKIVDTVPEFLSQYLHDIIVIATTTDKLASHGLEQVKGYKGQVPVRLKSLRESLSHKFQCRVLLPVFSKAYTTICNCEKRSIKHLMSILAEHINSIEKEDLSVHNHRLVDLFIMALDFRCNKHELNPLLIKDTEDSIIAAVLSMIVKLSESAFRPMYIKLYGWATRESDSKDRLITFYRLSDSIAEKLRGLFSLFASHIVKNAADILSSASADHVGYFDGDKYQTQKEYLLTTAVIDSLYKCFLYDTEGFVTKQVFNTLMQPLVNKLEVAYPDYESYVQEKIVPCISQLAVAAADDSLWKTLLYQVCLKTRHEKVFVRKGSLHVLRALNTKLGEDFMPLLPDTIPFLAELMEDDEEEVEALCQEVIADMEKVLGEPLQKYF